MQAQGEKWRARAVHGLGLIAVTAAVALGVIPSAGASVVTDKQYGFSFALPSRWTQIPLDSKDIGNILQAATKNDPSLTNVLDTQVEQAAKEGIKIFAVGPISNATFPNLNIAVESAQGSPTGSAFISSAGTEAKIVLAEAGARHLSVNPVRLAFGRALEATYSLQLKTTKLPLEGLQLYIEHGAFVYVLTISSLDAAEDQTVALTVTKSWRWI